MLQTASNEGSALDDCREFAQRINKGAARMIQLVDDLLRFSQTNSREIQRKHVEVAALAQEAIDDVVPVERRAQVHLAVPEGAEVLADAPMLKVALHNLLSNALKFTRGTPAPRIVIGHERSQGEDHLWVSDNGVGFDPKHKEQAFGVFKRLHQADQFEGTGVGLAIVHRIVTKHGGRAWAESTPGLGTTIHISVPNEVSGSGSFKKVA